MDLWYLLFELSILLGGAFLCGALAQRFKQSPILGYLLAGAIVGPLLFNAEAVNQSAELGVSLLLFSIGLEFSFLRIRQLGRLAIGGGSIQVALSLVCVTPVLIPWLSVPQAVTVGAIVALSSTAVVMRVLVDRSEIDSVRGRSCLAFLLLQDIAIVPLVIMVTLFSTETASPHIGLHILKIIASAGGLGLALYVGLHKVVPLLLNRQGVFANRELTVLLAIAIGLGASWGAHALGISPALGAFLAGLILGESPFATQIRADIGAVRTIMVTLFFASVGMLAKPMWFLLHLHWILSAALAIFIFKAVLVFASGRLFGLNNRQALATGISLAQVGEFSFVLATSAHKGGVLGSESYDLMISVIIFLMFVAPYMVSQAFPLTDRLLALFTGHPMTDTIQRQSVKVEPSRAVLIVGLGPAGQAMAHHLKERQWKPLILDTNPQSRIQAQALGAQIHLGDATNEEVLLHAGLKAVCMAVVTVPDPGTTIEIVELIHRLRPQLPIAARCRYHRHQPAVKKAGATIVVDEEIHMGHELAHQVVDFMQSVSGETMACRVVGQPFDKTVAPNPSMAESDDTEKI